MASSQTRTRSAWSRRASRDLGDDLGRRLQPVGSRGPRLVGAKSTVWRRGCRSWLAVCLATMLVGGIPSLAWANAAKSFDVEATLASLPWASIAPEWRDGLIEVMRSAHFHRRSPAELFECDPRLYLALVNEPVLTLGLWRDLGGTQAWLRRIGPARFQGNDGQGTTAVWDYVLATPNLHILHSHLNHVGPNEAVKLDARVVLILRTEYLRDAAQRDHIRHDVEVFVKIDSRGWKAIARVARPIIEGLLNDQVQEAGWFISVLGRLIERHPDWAQAAIMKQTDLPLAARHQIASLIQTNRKPQAQPGRPQASAIIAATQDAVGASGLVTPVPLPLHPALTR
ncbi:hypothetical protein Isop_3512 [Isosphaera pallida ATCC 43644]|uniref:Uncharacterized protein n=1 Tax=Isosphaera pallida (strain ATCC 43644 / DSM 9630 / IS1B) TaxID=575540 RepID=E8QXN2_ISOPI|nr:hypothetical protein Isop_3512 [Isosphaera pallida ATCC 43644]